MQAGGSTVFRPKDILLELARAWIAAADGPETVLANPHFLPMAEWSADLGVLHGAALELACPVPQARNLLLLDGEDLLGLAEEDRLGNPNGLRRQRLRLMDQVFVLGPATAAATATAPGAVPLRALPPMPGLAAAEPRPVPCCDCAFETGPYKFLGLRRQPELGASPMRALLERARRESGRYLVAFATPRGLLELGPVLRAIAALPDGPALVVCFFGTPGDLAAGIAAQPEASLFGDRFACPRIRFLFGPFAAADLLEAVAGAAASIESSHGGVLEALARALGVPNRLVMGPDGGFDAWQDGAALAEGIAWQTLHAPEILARRHRKGNRAAERRLLAVLAGIAA